MSETPNTEPTFELGLVMAGAVSAGAYTAGVLDFLLQALDAWQDLKDEQSAAAPPHNVLIKALSGASAGGILAAMLGTLVNRDVQPVKQAPPAGTLNNKLYEAWVERIDLERLLESRDLAVPGAQVKSLLDSTVLEDIADSVFDDQGKYKYRPYFDKNLHLFLSLTNLRGVPYSIAFQSETRQGHELSLHADYLHFLVSGQEQAAEDALRLDPYNRQDPRWQILKQASLATSAYPLALAPRLLQRKARDYNKRKWRVPAAPDPANGKPQCYQNVEIPPHWPVSYLQDPEHAYDFLCVDGGMTDNEPLELARRVLAGESQHNPRDGRKACRAVIMIDPFPEAAPFDLDYAPEQGTPAVLLKLFAGLKYQSRFKPDELRLAMQEDIYSRFLISPARHDLLGRPQAPALASASLAAFGGFLSRDFRLHDFQLGRRNCQRFLSRYFALPEKNPLFERWPDGLRRAYRIAGRRGENLLPVVPLVGEALREVPALPWPRLPAAALRRLEGNLAARGDAVVGHLLPRQILWRLAGRLLWKFKLRRQVVNSLLDKIEQDLRQRGLYFGE